MDNKDFLKLVELLERESTAGMTSEAARTSETVLFQQTIPDLNPMIERLNDTIGTLLEEN